MPLILAHPAAVIPLAKCLGRRASLSALVIGSMTPDFAYLLPLGLVRNQTHDPLALIWFCLPLGLCTYFIFHLILAPACARLLPHGIASRLPQPVFFGHVPDTHIGAVVFCVLIGAFSHLAVDSITHRDGYIAGLLPFLQIYLGRVGASKVYVCKILQHAFSFLGVILIAGWVRDWSRNTAPSAGFRRASRRGLQIVGLCLLIVLPVAAGLIAGATRRPLPHRALMLKDRARTFLMAGGTTLALNWLALGFAVRRRPGDGNELGSA